MKMLSFLLFTALLSVTSSNEHKEAARYDIQKGELNSAISRLEKVMSLQKEPEGEVILNLAHLYFIVNNRDNAKSYYEMVSQRKERFLASIAENQLGLIYFSEGKKDSAEVSFKKALYLNDSNKEAAFNYELIKRTQKKVKRDGAGINKPSQINLSSHRNSSEAPEFSDNSNGSGNGELLRSVQHDFTEAEVEKILESFKLRNNKYLQQEEWKKLNLNK